MKILFHTNTLNYRGTAVAVADYARFNQEVLGNESVISYDASLPYEKDMGTEPEVLENLSKEFQVIGHRGNPQDAIDHVKCDLAYFLRSGNRDFVSNSCPTVVHAVFQLYEPHADRYAYISEWLAGYMNEKHNGSVPFVPHMVNLPAPTADLREALNIPQDKTIIGRIGGYKTFDLPFVKQAIYNTLHERDDYVFVMVGTEPWTDHPNVRFQREFNNLQTKANFINTCDAMLHARSNGESFGLAIVEALAMNKPILSYEGGGDQNHTLILKDSGLIYNTETFAEKLNTIRDYIKLEDWTQRVAQFRPCPVMEKFKEVFL